VGVEGKKKSIITTTERCAAISVLPVFGKQGNVFLGQ